MEIWTPRRRYVQSDGYVKINVAPNEWILEHRKVMADHLGRELDPDERVHHKNGNRQDNALANLELWFYSHPPGQRVVDQIEHSLGVLRRYFPEALMKGKKARMPARIRRKYSLA